MGIYKISGGGALGTAILVGVGLGAIASNAMNDDTGSLAVQTLNVRVRRPISAVTVKVCAYGLVIWLHSGDVVSRFSDLCFRGTG